MERLDLRCRWSVSNHRRLDFLKMGSFHISGLGFRDKDRVPLIAFTISLCKLASFTRWLCSITSYLSSSACVAPFGLACNTNHPFDYLYLWRGRIRLGPGAHCSLYPRDMATHFGDTAGFYCHWKTEHGNNFDIIDKCCQSRER